MGHFTNILRYAKPYKKYAIGHVIANVFYALFGTLSFIALKPMLDVIFKKNVDPSGKEIISAIVKKPEYTGFKNILLILLKIS